MELVEAAVVAELDCQRSEFPRRQEHLPLVVAGGIPGRLAAGRGIDGEQQARLLVDEARDVPALLQELLDVP